MQLNGDGSLHNWDLCGYPGYPLDGCPLVALPEEFGAVRTTGDLDLSHNRLASLPESFGSIRVGGDLSLYGNQISSLPESFGSIRVGGDLHLYRNQISSLPESFSNVTVGETLVLKYGGEEMGPALATARQMSFPNVKEVWK